MSSVLYALGRWSYRSRGLVLAIWLAALVLVGGGAVAFNQGTENSFSIPGTESQEALDSLSHTFPQVSGTSAQIVVVAPEGEVVEQPAIETAVADGVEAMGAIDGVSAASDPFGGLVDGAVAKDGAAAVISVQIDGSVSTLSERLLDELSAEADALEAALPDGSRVAVGGEAYSVSLPTLTITEAVGVVIALIVLIVTFGSFLAAGLPLLTALLGVAISMAAIFVATIFTDISSTTPMLALMLGLAVGIDYALFIISRHREQVLGGMDPEESTARAVATAGSAVIFAGLTVIIALVGLFVAGIPFLTVMGLAAAVAVGIAVLIAVTLTPAMLGFAGARMGRSIGDGRRARKAAAAAEAASARGEEGAGTASARRAPEQGNRFFAGWVRAATKWPALTIVLVVAGLGVVSVPALDLRLALPDAGSQAESSPARQTYDLLAEEFGEGYNGPLIVTGTIIGSTDPLGLMDDLKAEIEALPGVASVPLATPNPTADTGIIQVVPEGAPDSQQTKDLVAEIRSLQGEWEDEYGVELRVTGFTAVGIDVSDRLGAALLPFGILVVGLSLILLTMVFRSVWVPIKATVGYLLSVGASFGVVAAVFEWGWMADALHVARVGPVISFMPIILMGVLFGLAMDYEVFLVSRIREEYVHGGDARAAIRKGFLGSGKVVTAAAIIMLAVFAAFVPEGDSNIKPIALGLAVGVFVDAFIVRMTLVPAVLQLLGDRAWWMPRWLDRLLPAFDVEGEGIAKELALADWAPGTAVAADGLALEGVYSGVSATVPSGGALVIQGEHRTGKSALLLTIAGRVQPTGGRLKVDGLALPERAPSVRGRVALVRMAGEADPVGAVRRALAERPRILAVDDLDHVSDPTTQAELRALLSPAEDLSIVVSCVETRPVDAVLPPGVRSTLLTTAPALETAR
ncbi:MMPL family transporter [Arenivirga flava]|uniref:RND transporter n=1 Tax=Arenivirga flava TaxID=1930060 RepID=A0AA37UPF4_9MICO|nr:MMPL family transporter [Arenivirga flava]GMA28746.1 RND transporter [Arenivirga flava]